MPTEIALWRVDQTPKRIEPSRMPLESRLEEIIESDPAMLGEPLLLIGRQVPTAYGKFIDLLGIDAEGSLHILELKRDRTPRDVVAQVLDYGSWIQDLSNEEVRDIFDHYQSARNRQHSFDQAFAVKFGVNPPESLNTAHTLTVVASEMDSATERMVTYLATSYDVPINVLFFAYYEDDGRKYLARTWMIDEGSSRTTRPMSKSNRKQEPWNGQDWYVSFGEEHGSRSWEDARKYGFVSAGGGTWFSRTLRQVPVGARVFVYIPKSGYVGVAEVTGDPQTYESALLSVDGNEIPMMSIELAGKYVHDLDRDSDDDQDRDEWILPVRWIQTVDRSAALRATGLFANQNSACKLRNRFTLEELARFFDLN
jgi:hypothetical protein